MGRLLAGMSALFAYLCVSTVITLLILTGYAVSQGFLDKQKLADMLAVARGATLSSNEAKGNEKAALPEQMLSIEEIDQRRTTMTRHLELREQAVQNALEQIEAERDKLLKERQTFDLLVTAFRKEKQDTQSEELAKGHEDARQILENIPPRLAKDVVLKMLAADEKEEVVAILTAMPIAKQTKIFREFKDPDEQVKLDEILRLVRQRSGAAEGLAGQIDAAAQADQP